MGEMGRMGLRVRFTVWFRVVAGTRGGRDAWLDGTRRVVGWVAVTQSPCHLVTLSPSHPVTQSPCHPVTLFSQIDALKLPVSLTA